MKHELQELLKEEWYVQSFNSTPFLILPAGALSGLLIMPKTLGFGYSAFPVFFQDDYCSAHYRVKDLDVIYAHYKKEAEKNPRYLYDLRKRHEAMQKPSFDFFKELTKMRLGDQPQGELYKLARRAYTAIGESVGVAHIIESISLLGEREVRKELGEHIADDKKLNEALIELTSPTEPSFAFESEERLRKIGALGKEERSAAIQKYLHDFGWIQNSYAGRIVVSEKDVEEELLTLADISKKRPEKTKKEVLDRYKLPPKLALKLEILAFATAWQDERKKHILIAIDFMERILEAISGKTGIGIELLRYALPSEMGEGILDLRQELAERRKASLYLCLPGKTEVFTKEACAEAMRIVEHGKGESVSDLHGTAASVGTAIGRVKVCLSLAAIKEVSEGDILVASMTRPEYLPAMRKAAAFVTDEGGITCHAAIVAREMGKPCVIGTRNATKVLKNGDLVEVKGSHGLVILLEKA